MALGLSPVEPDTGSTKQPPLFSTRRLDEPVSDVETFNTAELALVVRHERAIQCERMGGYEEVVTADRCSFLLELHPDVSIDGIRRRFERVDLEDVENGVKLS